MSINTQQPPVAKKIEYVLEKHGDKRIDDYYWMNDKENPEVIDYLNAENAYCDEILKDTKDFQVDLFEEMKSRIKEDDESVPYKHNGYWYIVKYKKGQEYPLYFRKKETLEAKEELLFDCNKMAEGLTYFDLKGVNVSPDNKKVAFATDKVGRRQYTIQIKDLQTGELLNDKIDNVTGGSTWANDNETLFYTKKDAETLRSDKIFKHKVNTNLEDVLVFEELDETFNVSIYKTKTKKFLVIGSYSTLTTEFRILEAENPDGEFRLFNERERGVEYSIYHYDSNFYIITNSDGAYNFKIMKTQDSETTKNNWKDLIPHREEVMIEDIDIFKDYFVITERENGLNKILIQKWDNSESYYLPFNSETFTAYTTTNLEFDSKILRYSFNSMNTPSSLIDFDMDTKEKTVLKEQEVLGGKFDKNNYVEERIWAEARDGKKVPMSIVYNKNLKKESGNPVLQYAYGSYGHTIDPYFSTVRLSLLDRGFVYVITHIRGGEYLGRKWYEDGKLLTKKNTFTDFIDCSKHLINNGYTSANHLYAMGGSAGGMLMGGIINEAPELYNGIVSAVPFVDVVTTMLDDTIPLTTGEYDEWGNPNNKEYYDYMKSYSPYDNVKKQDYPNMLVTSGLHDSQVQYFEPTKWVAKLRDYKTDHNTLILRTNMDAGHGGASGRYDALKEVAEEYAFLFKLEGLLN